MLALGALQLNLVVVLLVLRLVHQHQRQTLELVLQLEQQTALQTVAQILGRLLVRVQTNESAGRQVERLERIEIAVDDATVQIVGLAVVNVFAVVAAI